MREEERERGGEEVKKWSKGKGKDERKKGGGIKKGQGGGR